MGKGDKRTRKGKISAGSYGNSRPHQVETTKAAVVAKPVAVAKKAPARKTAAKKA